MKLTDVIKNILHYLNLESELDNHDLIHEEIQKSVIFKGTNLWILVFAIIIASVGLNMNSTAVIIGAMLISPLMGPINGIGYSIATYNFELFRQSVKNFGFAVIMSLIASTAYFILSPVSTAHSELLARTSPTIYDVLIALFGGLAGIVAISSKQKGNVIPGVAIATALMPPLCTAGYGLATTQWFFFFGAFYLFTINTVFIALASVTISQILKFPIRTLVDNAQKKRVNSSISAVIVIVLLPSIYFGYNLVQKERFAENANQYIANVSIYEGNYLLKSEVNADKKLIHLIYGGKNLTLEQKELIAQKAENFNLNPENVLIKQGLSFDNTDDKNIEVFKLREQLNQMNFKLREQEVQFDSLSQKSKMGRTLLNEIKQLYPQIMGCTYAESFEFKDTLSTPHPTAIILFSLKSYVNYGDKQKIKKWTQARLESENVRIIYE